MVPRTESAYGAMPDLVLIERMLLQASKNCLDLLIENGGTIPRLLRHVLCYDPTPCPMLLRCVLP
eukprot:2084788-Rhodomonas_salina.2